MVIYYVAYPSSRVSVREQYLLGLFSRYKRRERPLQIEIGNSYTDFRRESNIIVIPKLFSFIRYFGFPTILLRLTIRVMDFIADYLKPPMKKEFDIKKKKTQATVSQVLFEFIPDTDSIKVIIDYMLHSNNELDDPDILSETLYNTLLQYKYHVAAKPFLMDSTGSESKFDSALRECRKFKYKEWEFEKTLSVNSFYEFALLNKIERHFKEMRQIFDPKVVEKTNERIRDMIEKEGKSSIFKDRNLEFINNKHRFFMLDRKIQKQLLRKFRWCRMSCNLSLCAKIFISNYIKYSLCFTIDG